MKDYAFSINNFNQPLELDGNKAVYTYIIKLLLLEKGTIKSHPEMGVGILSYRYSDIENIDTIKQSIYDQIGKYMPTLMVTDIRLNFIEKEKALQIIIIINNEIHYIFNADYKNNVVTLQDLIS